jgi:hypothetical protein
MDTVGALPESRLGLGAVNVPPGPSVLRPGGKTAPARTRASRARPHRIARLRSDARLLSSTPSQVTGQRVRSVTDGTREGLLAWNPNRRGGAGAVAAKLVRWSMRPFPWACADSEGDTHGGARWPSRPSRVDHVAEYVRFARVAQADLRRYRRVGARARSGHLRARNSVRCSRAEADARTSGAEWQASGAGWEWHLPAA